MNEVFSRRPKQKITHTVVTMGSNNDQIGPPSLRFGSDLRVPPSDSTKDRVIGQRTTGKGVLNTRRHTLLGVFDELSGDLLNPGTIPKEALQLHLF